MRQRRRWWWWHLVIVALVAASCGGEPAVDSDDGEVREPLPIRFVVKPNPAAGQPDAAVELRTVPGDDGSPAVIHEHLMAVERADAKVDVHGAEALDVLVNGEEALTIPRHFWEAMSRGWLVVRIQPGGIELTRSVEPDGNNERCAGNDDGETCWSTEKWYFPGPLWGSGDTAAVPVLVILKARAEFGEVPVRIHAGDETGPVLEETSTTELHGQRWQTTVDIEQDASLVIVVGDRHVELPPDLWQLSWTSARVELTEDTADFVYRWPTSSRRLDRLQEALAVTWSDPAG